MASLGYNPIHFRRYLLLGLLSIAFAYPLCVVLMNNHPTKHAKSVPKWGLTGSMRHLASQFDLQYLIDAGGKQAKIDDTLEDFYGDIPVHYSDPAHTVRNTRSEFSPDGDEVTETVRHRKAKESATAIGLSPRYGNTEVPAIIHQTWEDLMVPGQNAPWIASWKKNHPSWDYWFWTEQGASLMVQENFSKCADMYINYPYKINRADARRYFIMYAYGGVYADLDVESLRPLDELLKSYKCIIAQEPEEHQVLLYQKRHPNYIMPAFIACRPHHPFFKLVLEMLPQYANRARDLPWNDNIFQSTGPMFLARVLEKYLKYYNKTIDEYIHLAPPSWFMPTYDSMNDSPFRVKCSNNSLLLAEKSICGRLKARNFSNVPSAESYTAHHWIHSWSNSFSAHGYVTIASILKDNSFKSISGK